LQFGSNGIVAGFFPVDVNAFRGTRDQLAAIFHPSAQKGPLMALSDQEQRELLEKTRDVHHELVHRFQSRYRSVDGEQSGFRDTLVGFVLEIDRKIEDIHANMLPTIWSALKHKLKGGK